MREKPRAQAELKTVPAEPQSVRSWVVGILAVTILAGAGYFVQLVGDPAAFPIRKVKVEGDFRHLAPQYVEKLVSGAVNGGFFSVDVETIRQRILEEPWLYDVAVQRVWPDTIRVSIKEQEPVAYWGENALLNGQADIFAPDRQSFPPDLVALQGPIGSETDVLRRFRSAQSQFGPRGLRITRLTLSERRAWVIEVAGGTTIVIGRHAIDQRLERFSRAYDSMLKDHWARIATIDLRYTNGFAIRERAASDGEIKARNG